MMDLLFLVRAFRALVEVALLAVLAQGVLGLLAGASRQDNPVYRLFALIASPVLHGMRRIMPRGIPDRSLPGLSFFILFFAWLGLAWAKWLIA